MSVLMAVLVAFAVAFSAAPVNVSESPVSAQQVVTAPTVLETDAAATLDDKGVPPEVTSGPYAFQVIYVESSPSSDSLPGEFTLESIDLPGTFHHYSYTQLHFA